jgi:hypothetical protein
MSHLTCSILVTPAMPPAYITITPLRPLHCRKPMLLQQRQRWCMYPTRKPLAAGLHCHHGGKAVQICPHPVMLYAAACTAMCAVFREVTSTLNTDWLLISQSAVRL